MLVAGLSKKYAVWVDVEPEQGPVEEIDDGDSVGLVLVTQVELEALVARVEALEEVLDALVSQGN